MTTLFFITHPDVVIEPDVPVERWWLNDKGVARMRSFAHRPDLAHAKAVWASTEAKAIEAAGILAGALGLGVRVDAALGENDRSATGYLPHTEFQAVADAFFANPDLSIRGWERAVDAQARIVSAVRRIVAAHEGGDLAVVAQGGVGALLLCALSGQPISRSADQPFQGHVWTASLPGLAVTSGWEPIAPLL